MNVGRVENFMDTFDTIFLFYDETIWLDKNEIAKSCAFIQGLRDLKKRILFMMHGSTYSRREISEKLKTLNIQIDPEDIVCTMYLLARYVKRRVNDQKVFVVGSSGMSEELSLAGVPNIGSGPDILDLDLPTFVHTFKFESDVAAVLVGFDEHISYPKLVRAATYLSDPKTIFIATNSIRSARAFVICTECCSGRKAYIFEEDLTAVKEALYDSHDFIPERTLLVGTRSRTGVLFGKRCGFKTLSISNTSIPELDPEERTMAVTLAPDFCSESLSDLLSATSVSTTP